MQTKAKLYLLSSIVAAGSFTAALAPVRADKKADGRIEKRIEERLKEDERLRAYTLDVEVEDGVATLSGKVALDAAKAHAETVADIEGVERVDNQIQIAPLPLKDRLQQMEQRQTTGHPAPADPATVPPDHVDSEGQAPRQPVEPPAPAIQLVNPEKMVQGDTITDPAAAGITKKLMTQLMAHEDLKGSDIKVEANEVEGVVILRGTVLSEADRARAVEIARTTAGVQKVTDSLRVAPRP